MQVETITDRAAFEALSEAWEELRTRSGSRCAYLTMPWLLAWLEGFGGAGALRVLCAREEGRLVGALPLLLTSRTLAKMPVRALHTLSLNVAYCDFLLAPGAEGACDALLEEALAGGGFQILLLKGIPAGGDSERLLREALTRRGLRHEASQESEIFLDLSGGEEGYRSGRKTKFWSNVRNRRGRIAKQGEVVYERARDAADAARILPEILDVSLRSWKGKAGSAVGLQEDHTRFLRRLFERGAASGTSEVWLLRVDGRAIAYRFCVRAGAVVAELDIAYDEEWKPFSPGTLLSAESNEAYLVEGVTEINLGLDFPWKQEWVPESRNLLEVVIYARGLYPALVRRVKAWAERRSRNSAGTSETPPTSSVNHSK